jgi:hypothetical protein
VGDIVSGAHFAGTLPRRPLRYRLSAVGLVYRYRLAAVNGFPRIRDVGVQLEIVLDQRAGLEVADVTNIPEAVTRRVAIADHEVDLRSSFWYRR